MLYHLQWTQMLTGLQTGILTDVHTNIEYAPQTWWIHVRKFLNHIQGNLYLEAQYTFHPIRQEDYSIMQRLSQSGNYGKATLRRINACRLYLRIMYMSEMVTTSTTFNRAWLTHADPHTESTLDWPVQGNPNRKTWKLWKKTILEFFVNEDGHTLREPVGHVWLPNYAKTRQWDFHYDPHKKLVRNRRTHETYIHTKSTQNQHTFLRSNTRSSSSEVEYPIQVIPCQNTLYATDLKGTLAPENSPTNLPAETTTKQHTMLATDGSVKHGKGTYGWIKGNTTEDTTSGSGHVTGGPGTMNSYRAEAQGVASILANSTNAEIKGAQLYLDNQGVVRRLQQI